MVALSSYSWNFRFYIWNWKPSVTWWNRLLVPVFFLFDVFQNCLNRLVLKVRTNTDSLPSLISIICIRVILFSEILKIHVKDTGTPIDFLFKKYSYRMYLVVVRTRNEESHSSRSSCDVVFKSVIPNINKLWKLLVILLFVRSTILVV